MYSWPSRRQTRQRVEMLTDTPEVICTCDRPEVIIMQAYIISILMNNPELSHEQC